VFAGDKDPAWMADYAKGTWRAKRKQLEQAQHGLLRITAARC
jgi:hypothetical protein